MSRVRSRGEDVRKYIIENVEKFPNDISKKTAQRFGISRQAVNKHLRRLTDEKALSETGETRSRAYKLAPLVEWQKTYSIADFRDSPVLGEDLVWRDDVQPLLGQLPDNAMNIWNHGFTEMFNNALDHSAGSKIHVRVKKTAATTEMAIGDDGVGIFKKIQAELGLLDERHAVLELAKGKLTTDPANHSGEGIFFCSRVFDEYDILSGGVFFSHEFGDEKDWILERDKLKQRGTLVWLKLHNHTARTMRKIYDQFTGDDDDHGFNKTVVPVRLAKYGNDQLVSRSQAKRVIARVELFKIVIFDFSGVEFIGQAFADEMFRVFANRHPEIALEVVHANSAVKRMIDRAKSGPAVTGEGPKK